MVEKPSDQAYLADVVPAERLPRFMVFREASATFAFIIGPLLGGYMIKACRCLKIRSPYTLTQGVKKRPICLQGTSKQVKRSAPQAHVFQVCLRPARKWASRARSC